MIFLSAAIVTVAPARADDAQKELTASIPAGNALTFKAFTGDTELGLHKMNWSVQGDAVIVKIEIDLGARVLFVPVYAYKHRSTETWRNGQLSAIVTSTDDDGDKEFVNGELNGDVFTVKSTLFNGNAPLPMAPTSYWNYANLKKPNWLNTQTGKMLKISARFVGEETIKSRAGEMRARRYDMSGDAELSLWYDAQNRWVKSRFAVDGTTITYVLQ